MNLNVKCLGDGSLRKRCAWMIVSILPFVWSKVYLILSQTSLTLKTKIIKIQKNEKNDLLIKGKC